MIYPKPNPLIGCGFFRFILITSIYVLFGLSLFLVWPINLHRKTLLNGVVVGLIQTISNESPNHQLLMLLLITPESVHLLFCPF